MLALSTMMMVANIIFKLRMALSMDIISTTYFRHLWKISGMSKWNMNRNCMFMISRLSLQMEKLVSSSNDLCRDFNDFISVMVVADFFVDLIGKTLDKNCILSSWVALFNSSNHVIKIQVYYRKSL